jgi:hypothetical protein
MQELEQKHENDELHTLNMDEIRIVFVRLRQNEDEIQPPSSILVHSDEFELGSPLNDVLESEIRSNKP